MSENGKKIVLYIGNRTDLLPKGTIRNSGEEAPIIKMVKKAYPSLEFDDILVEANRSITGKAAFSVLLEECESGKIEMVVVPSLGSSGSGAVDVMHFVHRLQKADPEVKVFFALEEVIHPSDEFDLKVIFHYLIKDEYALARKKKREFINV